MLYRVQGTAKPVLLRPNSTEPNLFHDGEPTYRVGWMSENPTLVQETLDGGLKNEQEDDLFVRS